MSYNLNDPLAAELDSSAHGPTHTIWKYSVAYGVQTVLMPEDSDPLSVGAQGDAIALWCWVNPAAPMRAYRVAVAYTGDSLSNRLWPSDYVGTVQLVQPAGPLVYHVFFDSEDRTP